MRRGKREKEKKKEKEKETKKKEKEKETKRRAPLDVARVDGASQSLPSIGEAL